MREREREREREKLVKQRRFAKENNKQRYQNKLALTLVCESCKLLEDHQKKWKEMKSDPY